MTQRYYRIAWLHKRGCMVSADYATEAQRDTRLNMIKRHDHAALPTVRLSMVDRDVIIETARGDI